MTFALTKFEAYGIEIDEPIFNRFKQYAVFIYTAANTDVNLDIGTYAGTFWTAVGGTEPGITGLKSVKDINIRTFQFLSAKGQAFVTRAQVDSSRSTVLSFTSNATAGGSASETVTVTGLQVGDIVLSADRISGGNAVSVVGIGTPAANSLPLVFSADPGVGALVRVAVLRTVVVPEAGTYQIAMDGTNVFLPNILFVTGDAPTTAVVVLEWELKSGETPVKVVSPNV